MPKWSQTQSKQDQNSETALSDKAFILLLIKMFYICTVQHGSPWPHVTMEHLNGTSVTQEQNFYSIINFHLNRHMWLVATALDRVAS